MVGFLSSKTGEVPSLEFTVGKTVREIRLPHRLTADNSDTVAEPRLVLGLIQAPRYRFADDLAADRLVEVLEDYSPSRTPLFALYPQNRQLTSRLRVFLDWVLVRFKETPL